jgi:hypothetical protein
MLSKNIFIPALWHIMSKNELFGTPYSGKCAPARQGKLRSEKEKIYYPDGARRYREKIGIPLILVEGIRTLWSR